MAWSGFHITKSGRDLLNRCLTTGAFRFVKVVLGDGAYTGSWDDYAPVSPKMTFEGEDMRVYRSGDSTRVEISLTSDGNTTGWYYREYALFATDGSDTVVFACDTCGGDGEYIDPSNPSVLLDDRLCWEFVISADASVNVTYQISTYVPAQGGESGETVVTFTEAQDASLEDLSSGASLSSLWSIAKKLLADLLNLINAHTDDKNNPHGVTAEQVGARPNTWTPTAQDVGARPDTWTPTADQVSASAKPVILTGTLTAEGWSGSAAPYSQTLTITGIPASQDAAVFVSIAPTSTAAQMEVWGACMVMATGHAQNSITFSAMGDKPEADLPVQITVLA